MAREQDSPTEGDDSQEEDVQTAIPEVGEHPGDAAVNPSLAYALLGETGEREGDDSAARERRDEGGSARS